ncbi:MAG: Tll0287-like domain-containing protein [Nitrospiraceae bacterium]
MKRSLVWGTVLVLLILVGGISYWGIRAMLKGADQPVAIPLEKVADYVHAVIEANRTVYATNVVDKMQEKGIVEAAEHWRQENALPLPAQFLIDTGRLVAERGLGIKYRLASLSPIYVWNNAQSDFERKGLEAVATNPERPFTGFVRIGRERFFQAVYADRAVAHACAECHNRHPNSPRRDYKLNDVMGGIVITIPAGP